MASVSVFQSMPGAMQIFGNQQTLNTLLVQDLADAVPGVLGKCCGKNIQSANIQQWGAFVMIQTTLLAVRWQMV